MQQAGSKQQQQRCKPLLKVAAGDIMHHSPPSRKCGALWGGGLCSMCRHRGHWGRQQPTSVLLTMAMVLASICADVGSIRALKPLLNRLGVADVQHAPLGLREPPGNPAEARPKAMHRRPPTGLPGKQRRANQNDAVPSDSQERARARVFLQRCQRRRGERQLCRPPAHLHTTRRPQAMLLGVVLISCPFTFPFLLPQSVYGHPVAK